MIHTRLSLKDEGWVDGLTLTTVRGGVSQAVIGLERERYITSHPPKTVSTHQDHSLKECHHKWVSQVKTQPEVCC